MPFTPGNRKPILGVPGDDDALDEALGLGELAGLTVTNEADPMSNMSYDVSDITQFPIYNINCNVSL